MIANSPLGHLKISRGGLPLFVSYVKETIEHKRKAYCIPLNVTKYELAKSDPKLRETIKNAQLVIADGSPIYWLGRRLKYRDVRRVSGIGLAEALLAKSARNRWSIFFLGSSPENLEKAVGKVKEKFPGIPIAGHLHGYFRPEDLPRIVSTINEVKPDLFLLGLGLPQKEYFIHDHFHEIDAAFWLAVGGAFDVWAEVKKRSHPLVQKIGLEWLFRSLYDKSRAGYILKYGFHFLGDFLAIKK